jgi:VWFA-related protein
MNVCLFHKPEVPQARFMSWLKFLLVLMVAARAGTAAPFEQSPTAASTPTDPIASKPPAMTYFQMSPRKQSPDVAVAADGGLVSITTFVDKSAFPWLSSAHPNDFIVYENGVRQQNVKVAVEHAPLSIGILLEYGGRYHTLNDISGEKAWAAAKDLLQEIGPDDKVALWKYADTVDSILDWSSAAESGANTQFAPPAPSLSELNLYDAVITTLAKMHAMPGRKVLVLISSGLDTFSNASFSDAVAEARTADVPIYVVNLGPALSSALFLESSDTSAPYSDLNWKRAETELKKLAYAAGGGIYSPESSFDLRGVYDDLLAKLRLRYTIQYKPPSSASDSPQRIVRVELSGPMSGGVTGKRAVKGRLIAEAAYGPSHVSGSITDRTQAPSASIASQ